MKKLLFIPVLLLLFNSCKVFKSNQMLRTPKNYAYDKLADSLAVLDYKLAANDAIAYKVLTNDGFVLINLSSSAANNNFSYFIETVVQSDGFIKVPLLGQVKVAGLTIREAEQLLEEKFSKQYVNPYVTIRINNKRVIIFPGNNGTAKVVNLINNNTSLMEVIATAGGIPEDGKAYKVKLIRDNPNDPKKPLVYLFDLSRIDGVKDGKSNVQANDIIYVEPRYRPLKTLSDELGPLVTIVTSVLLIYQFYYFTR
ncbi:MAG: polysaccharide biosynthesis/export family protein [Bacteroidota bacterium]|jgi:polysaccharide export outer membrane protein|nr:polysaccharide biosynthesis/export family protein [Bacteroidota bacterium]MCA6444718.1 polysaccharide biosynthesis/export family protein [Bacteroidota bacterium]